MVIWYVDWPAYGPKGAGAAECVTLRTCVPTYAVSVPDRCTMPPSVTSAVTDIELEKRFATNGGMGGVGGVVGGGIATLPGGGDGEGAGGEGAGVSINTGGGEG